MAASPEQGRAVIADEGTGADTPEGDREDLAEREVGVGPHPHPWPDDPRLDPRELAAFLASVARGEDPAVTGQQGTAALELALEITRRINA